MALDLSPTRTHEGRWELHRVDVGFLEVGDAAAQVGAGPDRLDIGLLEVGDAAAKANYSTRPCQLPSSAMPIPVTPLLISRRRHSESSLCRRLFPDELPISKMTDLRHVCPCSLDLTCCQDETHRRAS